MSSRRLTTGVPGLDAVLHGGFIENSLYLVKGAPGTGKTTLGIQFLIEGAKRGEKCLYLGLSETRGQLSALAASYGWSLEGIDIHDMRRRGKTEDDRRSSYTIFSPSEVELGEISDEILEQVDRVQPARLVLDSLSEIRLLAEDPFRYRRELLVLSDRISGKACTGLLIDVEAEGNQGAVAETLVGGVIILEQLSPEYGGDRRRLRVRKLRASSSIGGYHDMRIGEAGVTVFPRLVAAAYRALHSSAEVLSGLPRLDALLGGGIDRGTSTILIGPSGTGKSTLAAQFVSQAACRAERGFFLCFDESPTNLLIRATALGIPLQQYVDSGVVEVLAVDPAEFTPGELTYRIHGAVESGARIVVIDSLNGYIHAMPEERFLTAHLHELLAYMSEKGVATLLTLAQHGVFGGAEAPVNVSYIADTIMLLRYYEADGDVRQAISVMKKRTGRHERAIRELTLSADGISIGERIRNSEGILSGNPRWLNSEERRGDRGRSG